MNAEPENILERIAAQKRREIARLPPGPVEAEALAAAVKQRGPARDFAATLETNQHQGIRLIAEVKKASPSAGVICHDFDPVAIARQYETAGASCLSILTDEQFFQGSLSFLGQIRRAVALPLLRKDFIIDERQILESVAAGADAALLIVALLSDELLRALLDLAARASLAALVEVHDESELERALAAGARLIGVNNRDLRTFQVDLSVTERLAAKLSRSPRGRRTILVAESGIHTRKDVERLARCGASAILVGESLMRSGNIPRKIGALLGREK